MKRLVDIGYKWTKCTKFSHFSRHCTLAGSINCSSCNFKIRMLNYNYLLQTFYPSVFVLFFLFFIKNKPFYGIVLS